MHAALSSPLAQANLDRYLRRATLGLPPEHAQEVRDELEEHALGLVDRYVLAGHAPQDALRLALADLGSPWQVGLSLNGVHNMPKLIALTAGVALAASAAFYALAGGGAKVLTLPIVSQGPKSLCVDATEPQPKLTLVGKYRNTVCYQDDATRVNRLFVSLPTAKKLAEVMNAVSADLTPNGTLKIVMEDDSKYERRPGVQSGPMTLELGPDFRAGSESYVEAAGLLNLLIRYQPAQNTPPIRIRSANELEIQNGEQVVRLPGVGHTSLLNVVYTEIGSLVVRDTYRDASPKLSWSVFPVPERGPTRRVLTSFTAGEVVLALGLKEVRDMEGGEQGHFLTSAAVTVQADGSILLPGLFQSRNVRFVTNPHQLTPLKSSQSWPVLLVKVSDTPLNNLKSGIFLPKS
ncbi:hypothetical protein [Deinococcus sp. PESE-13]